MKVYPLFQAGKSLSSKFFFILEMKVSSVLVGREVKCEVLVIWKFNNS